MFIVRVIRTDPILHTKRFLRCEQGPEEKGVRLLKTIFAFAIVLMGICDYANAQRGGTFPRAWHDASTQEDGFWVDVGGAVFDRPGIDIPTAVVQNSVTNEVLLTIEDLTDLQTSFGSNIAFGGRNKWCGLWDVEATLVNWDTSTTITGDNLILPIGNDAPVDILNVQSDSDLASIEFNIRRPLSRGLTLTAGPRYFRLDEQTTFATTTNVAGLTFLTNNSTRNTFSMAGAQVGGEFRQQIAQSVFFRTHGNFAGFVNRIESSTVNTDIFGAATETDFDTTDAAFIGEVGGRLIWDIVPGALQSYVGYEAVWLGLGNDGDDTGSIADEVADSDDAIFYQQILFGVTLSR